MAAESAAQPLLGITAGITLIPRRLVKSLDLLSNQAIEVSSVVAGTPASEVGLQAGDWIVAINGRMVESVDDLHQILSRPRSSREFMMSVIRFERLLDVPVRLQLE